MRTTATTLAFLVVLLGCRFAGANPGITGYSGKPYGGTTQTCVTNCHANSGAKPTLTVDVPSALTAGETAQVSITVAGSNTRTSLNAALSDGVTATAGQNTTIPFPNQTPGEVAAVAPPPAGGSATYEFSFVAPNKNGPIMLWVAGMAASGSGTGGDGVSFATRTITISGATSSGTPDAGSSSTGGGKDGGSASSGDGGAKNGSPGSSSSDGDDDDDDDSTTGSGGGRRLNTDSGTGCATAPGGATGSIASALAAASIVTLLRRRRR